MSLEIINKIYIAHYQKIENLELQGKIKMNKHMKIMTGDISANYSESAYNNAFHNSFH